MFSYLELKKVLNKRTNKYLPIGKYNLPKYIQGESDHQCKSMSSNLAEFGRSPKPTATHNK